jgi:hypothetical protein
VLVFKGLGYVLGGSHLDRIGNKRFPNNATLPQDFELVITMARGLILCLLHALAVASALVITPAVRAVRLAPRAACPTMDGDGPMVGKCKWFK